MEIIFGKDVETKPSKGLMLFKTFKNKDDLIYTKYTQQQC